ncbi:MAG: CDGSH iron-sulfur domain-containing protein [Bacteroidales bacterium]|nr:CDGSH iron-sulfur domain-containing protein [Bacteroidales bacterium]MCF8402733.1 CDGSH iron-sulfur domain-containing protein [Bacteroidales bacterium]
MNKNNNETSTTRITITDNGPVLVNGQFQVHDANGKPIETAETIALCRCGASGNKPFCDGTHHQTGFKG